MKCFLVVLVLSLAACGPPTNIRIAEGGSHASTDLEESKKSALNKSLIVDDSLMWH